MQLKRDQRSHLRRTSAGYNVEPPNTALQADERRVQALSKSQHLHAPLAAERQNR